MKLYNCFGKQMAFYNWLRVRSICMHFEAPCMVLRYRSLDFDQHKLIILSND